MKYEETVIGSVQDIPFVSKTPIIIHEKDSGYQAIVNEDTKDTISIVSNDYQLVPHLDVWKEIQKQDALKVNTATLCKGGRVMMIELVEKSPVKVELFPGDYMEKRVRVFNSYDCSRALSVQSYAMRLVCSNGMIAPVTIDEYRKVHAYSSIAVGEISKHIELAMEAWQFSSGLIASAAKLTVKVEDALQHVNKLPDKYIQIVTGNLGQQESVYDIWNELTRTISHDVAPNVQVRRVVKMQQYVNKVFDLVKA